MPIRNLFRRSQPDLPPQTSIFPELAFRDASVKGTKPEDDDVIEQVVEFQLSEIDDSGVFVPPPSTEKPRFWQTRSNSSLASSNYRSIFSEAEPFNMSRESFDSYRRSFDISARSPISATTESLPRISIDSSLAMSVKDRRRADWPEDHREYNGHFEDVGLNDERLATSVVNAYPNTDLERPSSPIKKRNLFARFVPDGVTKRKANGSSESELNQMTFI